MSIINSTAVARNRFSGSYSYRAWSAGGSGRNAFSSVAYHRRPWPPSYHSSFFSSGTRKPLIRRKLPLIVLILHSYFVLIDLNFQYLQVRGKGSES